MKKTSFFNGVAAVLAILLLFRLITDSFTYNPAESSAPLIVVYLTDMVLYGVPAAAFYAAGQYFKHHNNEK